MENGFFKRMASLGSSYMLGTFNDNFFKQSVLLLAISLGHDGYQAWGTLLFALPYVLFSAWGGWLADLLDDLGAEIVRIGVLAGLPKSYVSASGSRTRRVTEDYSWEMLADDLKELDPDLLIADFPYPAGGKCRVARTKKVGVGVIGTMDYAVYLENVMRLPASEGWKEAVL